ncbi:MAG TPA: arabinan endo-1,5-alpha-L-arabinosidase [Balneolaceae bacterium]|nr:arabinan endo-1,5-alpha-L-arabinosidase [Balneolaceae bacterium]
MKQKIRIHISFVVGLLVVGLMVACRDSVQSADHETGPANPDKGDTTNADSLNPHIPDDYSDIANISNFGKWGTYNVHDPTIIKDGEYYYIYSTDVYYGGAGVPEDDPRKDPKIPIRRSKDLVHWQPIGHVFSNMPQEIVDFIRKKQPSYYPNAIWAPFIIKVGEQFRLYYAAPANNFMHVAYLGLAVSSDPEGPWKNKGLVLPTYQDSEYNGIDPDVVVDRDNGRQWLIFGSWDNGIHAVELDPETGFRKDPDDLGHIIASRALREGSAPLEGAEVQYNPKLDKYFLFVSYDELFEPYNVRVGRADHPQGPYYGFKGQKMSEQTDNFPKITAQYHFNNHSGWQGVGHTGILRDGDNYYLASQGRLGKDPNLMDLHIRKIFWTNDGWPTLSPERYDDVPQSQQLNEDDITGKWEYIYLDKTFEMNKSEVITLKSDGRIEEYDNSNWSLDGKSLTVTLNTDNQFKAQISRGWDWENNQVCLVFTGLSDEGISEWGKKVQD